MAKRLYYVRCIAKLGHGTQAEREIKEYSRQFHDTLVDNEGWWSLIRKLNDFTREFREDHPMSKLVNVTYTKVNGSIFFNPENKDCGGDLLRVIPIQQFYLNGGKKTVIRDGNEYAEEE